MGKPNPTSPPATVPAIDEHVVSEEGRLELIDGELVTMAPAEEPHGRQHVRLSYLLEAHVAADYLVAADMLTRSAQDQDFAPDCSVYPRSRDEYGKRKLDVLSFEVVGRQPMSIATSCRAPSAAEGLDGEKVGMRKAAILVARGVRRVFAIDVEEGTVCEWDVALSVWCPLSLEESIRDEALVCPLRVAALLDDADADDAVFGALRAKNNPALLGYGRINRLDGREEGKREVTEKDGQLLGRRQLVLDLCEVLSVPLTQERLSSLSTMTLPQLEALVSHLKAHRQWPQPPETP